mmetsp:Transcript_47125/g.137005  ORF Transcript_47125/g.137005 Transcript_47125/m.137005 type:complete len:413 (+) Transcript_47125:559-1797(+)
MPCFGTHAATASAHFFSTARFGIPEMTICCWQSSAWRFWNLSTFSKNFSSWKLFKVSGPALMHRGRMPVSLKSSVFAMPAVPTCSSCAIASRAVTNKRSTFRFGGGAGLRESVLAFICRAMSFSAFTRTFSPDLMPSTNSLRAPVLNTLHTSDPLLSAASTASTVVAASTDAKCACISDFNCSNPSMAAFFSFSAVFCTSSMFCFCVAASAGVPDNVLATSSSIAALCTAFVSKSVCKAEMSCDSFVRAAIFRSGKLSLFCLLPPSSPVMAASFSAIFRASASRFSRSRSLSPKCFIRRLSPECARVLEALKPGALFTTTLEKSTSASSSLSFSASESDRHCMGTARCWASIWARAFLCCSIPSRFACCKSASVLHSRCLFWTRTMLSFSSKSRTTPWKKYTTISPRTISFS